MSRSLVALVILVVVVAAALFFFAARAGERPTSHVEKVVPLANLT